MDFLAEPPAWAYMLLIAAVVLPAGAALVVVRRPVPKRGEKAKRFTAREWLFVVSGIALLLLLGLWVCDHFLESDQEQIVRKLNEMSAGIHDRNMNAVFQHVSNSFRLGGSDKAALRKRADDASSSGQVTEIKVWDVRIDSLSREEKKAVAQFLFKVEGSVPTGSAPFRCRAKFVLDPDNQWRLQSFDVFTPEGQGNPIQVPGVG
ncbi:MAG: hypothetical protein ACJ8F7_20555 [Gemmataceae bacterium]